MREMELNEYVPPFCTPEECDHQETNDQEGAICSRCCPCDECSDIRAADLGEQ
jgi:hypothetical protein